MHLVFVCLFVFLPKGFEVWGPKKKLMHTPLFFLKGHPCTNNPLFFLKDIPSPIMHLFSLSSHPGHQKNYAHLCFDNTKATFRNITSEVMSAIGLMPFVMKHNTWNQLNLKSHMIQPREHLSFFFCLLTKKHSFQWIKYLEHPPPLPTPPKKEKKIIGIEVFWRCFPRMWSSCRNTHLLVGCLASWSA